MLSSKLAQVALAVACFLLPLALSVGRGQQQAAGIWIRGEFEKSRLTHLTVGGEGDNVIRYAALDGRGVYRNTDDFFFWAAKSSGLPAGLLGRVDTRALAASPHDPRLVYIALDNGGRGGGIYRTINGGALWTLVDRKLAGRAQAVAVATSKRGPSEAEHVVYAAVGGRLYRSEARDSWLHLEQWPESNPITLLAVDPLDPGRLYVASSRVGLFQASDGGATWTVISEELRNLDILAIAVATVGNHPAKRVIYLGTDSGLGRVTIAEQEWTVELLWAGHRIHALAIDPARPDMLYAGLSRGGVYRSGDGGLQWEAMNRGLGGADVYALAFDPARPEILYAGTSDGVWRCTVTDFVPTATPPPTGTASPTSVPTSTPEPTATPTSTPLPSLQPTRTETATRTNTPTEAVTIMAPHTPTGTKVHTPTTPAIMTPTVARTYQPTPTATPTYTQLPTDTPLPTNTPLPPTSTPVPPTNTSVPPTNTPRPPTNTPVPPTNTPVPPTNTPVPPTNTPRPPTNTPVPPTDTPLPSTNTPVPTATLPPR